VRPLPSRLGQRAHDERAACRERGLNGGPLPRHARHRVGQFIRGGVEHETAGVRDDDGAWYGHAEGCEALA